MAAIDRWRGIVPNGAIGLKNMSDAIPTAEPGSVNLIVACDENRAIGRKGRLPWRIRDDWQWFLERTLAGACVIGRVSYEAMQKGGNVNDKRRFFVVSRDAALAGPDTSVFATTREAVDAAKASGLPVWICGGPRIYEETFAIADRLYLTRVHAEIEDCDAWMPGWTAYFSDSPVSSREGSDGKYSYSFEVYERKP
jgi:dihydrofolate reductase